MAQQRWLTTVQVAARVGMSSEWVRREILAGRLRAIIIRRGTRAIYRVAEPDLRAYLRRYGHDRP